MGVTLYEALGVTPERVREHLDANPDPVDPVKVASFLLNEVPKSATFIDAGFLAGMLKIRPICHAKNWRAIMGKHMSGELPFQIPAPTA